jgi:hypothetical protein
VLAIFADLHSQGMTVVMVTTRRRWPGLASAFFGLKAGRW